MAAIFEFDKLMSNGFVHRFLLLQDDNGIFTDIARGGPQAGEVGSVGLPSGGIQSGAGFGNLTTDVVPYYEGMTASVARMSEARSGADLSIDPACRRIHAAYVDVNR